MRKRGKRKVGKAITSYTFRFTLNGKRRQKTIRASDIYDAGQALKKQYPKATNLRLV